MAPRLEKFRVEEMNPEQREIYEAIAHGPRMSRPQLFPMVDEDGLLEGPWNVWLINPDMGRALEVMGSAYHVSLAAVTPRCREIATLIIGRQMKCEFELLTHIRVGRSIGLAEDEITDLVEGKPHQFADEVENVVAAAATEQLLDSHDLDDAQYEKALAALGLNGVFALTHLVSWYTMMAVQLNVFRVPLPEGYTVGS